MLCILLNKNTRSLCSILHKIYSSVHSITSDSQFIESKLKNGNSAGSCVTSTSLFNFMRITKRQRYLTRSIGEWRVGHHDHGKSACIHHIYSRLRHQAATKRPKITTDLQIFLGFQAEVFTCCIENHCAHFLNIFIFFKVTLRALSKLLKHSFFSCFNMDVWCKVYVTEVHWPTFGIRWAKLPSGFPPQCVCSKHQAPGSPVRKSEPDFTIIIKTFQSLDFTTKDLCHFRNR